MEKRTFELINAIQREGINGNWGVVENIDTQSYFGITEAKRLKGKYLYIYKEDTEMYCYINKIEPDKIIETEKGEKLLLYKLK